MIPEDLIPYIADTYVNSRQIDLKASKQNDELFAMTARQLLSTLRLAQAHAKLYFREKVTADDVEEALRLVYMSKASVVEVEEVKGRPEDIMSSSFWRQVRDGALAFAAQYNADGGDCTVVDLPKIGITGNSHFMFQELNKKEIADHIYQWLESRALA